MLDTDFDDFLDSDDDALFAEVSNTLTYSKPTSSGTTEVLNKRMTLSKPKSVLSQSSQELENKLQSKKENVTSFDFKQDDISQLQTSINQSDCGSCALMSKDNTVKHMITVPSRLVESRTVNTPIRVKGSAHESSYINNRFTPGFTPTAKRRKLPGPAGLLELFDDPVETKSGNSQKMLSGDTHFENIASSQFTLEPLSLLSWQKLQTAVSSCSNLHSTAKYYSIQRVLKESSKKKLPKHMIVPVLCVLLKKITYKGCANVSVFMDDTGEIHGKIHPDVLSAYKEYIVEGCAFILKKVTYLCNMLLLKAENLVSIYHPDGAEKHPQTLESVLETSEPLKPMKCECIKLTHPNIKNMGSLIFNENNDLSQHKFGCYSRIPNKMSYNANQTKNINKNASDLNSKPRFTASNTFTHVKSVHSDAFLEDLLDEENDVDDFDELLRNLDDKSFM